MATLNYTGRQEIDRTKIRLRLRDDDNKIALDVLALDLTDLDVPSTALVTVEAYRQTTKERIPCGTVGTLELPRDVNLSAFEVTDNIQLRVRVVGDEGPSHGKILAVADHLRGSLEQDQDSEPLLKLQRTDLVDLVWDFGLDNGGPILYLNKRLQNHQAVIDSRQFKAFVLPEFFRRVAIWLANNIDDSNDRHSTLTHWLVYFDNIGVDTGALDSFDRNEAGYNEQVEEWAAEAASAFASHMSSLALMNVSDGYTEEEEE